MSTSGWPKQCAGCGGEIEGHTVLMVGTTAYHDRDCWDRSRPPEDVLSDRRYMVEVAERNLAHHKQRLEEAVKRFGTPAQKEHAS